MSSELPSRETDSLPSHSPPPRRVLRSGANALWQARRSPTRSVRLIWWLTLIAGVAIVVSGQHRPVVFWTLWGSLNLGIALVCGIWGLFHPRCVFRVSRTISAFGFPAALLAVFLLPALQDALTSTYPNLVFSGNLLLIAALTLFLPALWLGLCLSALGASIGAFCGRQGADGSHSARYGVYGLWLTVWIGGALLAQNTPRVGLQMAAPVWCAAPLLACLAALLAPYVRVNNMGLISRLVPWLDRRLRMRLRTHSRTRILDLRGAFLGMVAGMALLLSGLTGLFHPVQTRLLAVLVQFRSAPLLAQFPTNSFERILNEDEEAKPTALDAERAARTSFGYQVIRMDEATRRDILQSGSETAVQARMIRLLSRYHCRLIVLPMPLLNTTWQRNNRPTLETPLADAGTVARGRRDLPQLQDALRAAGNVVLSLYDINRLPLTPAGMPSLDGQDDGLDELRTLSKAARQVGFADLNDLKTARLPAIGLHWSHLWPPHTHVHPGELPATPLVLFSALRGVRLNGSSNGPAATRFRLGRETLPVTDPDRILVSYFAGEPEVAFPTLTYHTVLSGVLLAQNEKNQKAWIQPAQWLSGKVVFLEGLDPHLRLTPIGNLSEPELLAHATLTLQTHSIVHRLLPLPLQQVVLTSLGFAALIGSLSLRRTPLKAGWYAVLGAALFVVVSLVAFLFFHIWIDVVLPLLAGGATYLLIVQYQFARDKWEVSRNRQLLERFMDKDTVEQLLDRGDDLQLGGVRRRVCVLFADVRGFTRFASEHDPEEVIATINVYLAAMAEQVDMHKGMLDKFLGDGMLALFGIPDANDAPLRAVQAALAMQAAAARISERLVAEGRHPLALGIGLHYGDAVFGLVGSVRRPDLTVIGYTVVVGQRIQSSAKGGEVILSDYLYAQVADAVIAEQREPIYVKGLTEPVVSYRLLGMRSLPDRQLPDRSHETPRQRAS